MVFLTVGPQELSRGGNGTCNYRSTVFIGRQLLFIKAIPMFCRSLTAAFTGFFTDTDTDIFCRSLTAAFIDRQLKLQLTLYITPPGPARIVVVLLSGAPGGGAVEASEAEWSTEGQAGLRARRRAWPSVPISLVPMIQVVLVDQSRVALMIAQRPRRGDRLITSSRPRKARSASELGDGPGLPYRSASCQSSGSFWSTRAVGLW